jgi:hypothetical protein
MVSSQAKERAKEESEKWGEEYAGGRTERQIMLVVELLRRY